MCSPDKGCSTPRGRSRPSRWVMFCTVGDTVTNQQPLRFVRLACLRETVPMPEKKERATVPSRPRVSPSLHSKFSCPMTRNRRFARFGPGPAAERSKPQLVHKMKMASFAWPHFGHRRGWWAGWDLGDDAAAALGAAGVTALFSSDTSLPQFWQKKSDSAFSQPQTGHAFFAALMFEQRPQVARKRWKPGQGWPV